MNNNLDTYWGNTHTHTYNGNTELAFLRSILSKIRTEKKTVNSVIISKIVKINLHSNLATKLIYKIPNPHPLIPLQSNLNCTMWYLEEFCFSSFTLSSQKVGKYQISHQALFIFLLYFADRHLTLSISTATMFRLLSI